MSQKSSSSDAREVLFDKLSRNFDISELKVLCFKLHIEYEDLSGQAKREKIIELIRYAERHGLTSTLSKKVEEQDSRPGGEGGGLPPGSYPAVCEWLDEKDWETLEQAVTKAVAAGGMAAMIYYRQPLTWPYDLEEQDQASKNPSTIADVQATVAVLQTISTYVAPLAGSMGCALSYFGEETREPYRSWIEKQVSDQVRQNIVAEDKFFKGENAFRVIADGLDGTGSFASGISMFCSAAAILIENQPRVSAVYDPVHHVVYSALLRGPYDKPEAKTKAVAWQVATGTRTDLVQLAKDAEQKNLQEEAIGVHLSRTKEEERREFLTDSIPLKERGKDIKVSKLERLATALQAIYAINCGILSMVDIARGALGGFVNQGTNLWDIAAGEVLVRACGGIVTDFGGKPINYAYLHRTSLIAAKSHIYDTIKRLLN